MKDLIQKLKKSDKLLHLVGGVYLYLLLRIAINKELAMAITIAFWILKEIVWDGFCKKGTPEFLDAVMSTSGAVSLYILDSI